VNSVGGVATTGPSLDGSTSPTDGPNPNNVDDEANYIQFKTKMHCFYGSNMHYSNQQVSNLNDVSVYNQPKL
jgi:hypothetical protein